MVKIKKSLKPIIEKLLEQQQNGKFAYQGLMAVGNYKDAVRELDDLLIADPASAEHRLSWILCQFALGDIPLLVLTAPLEEIFEKLKDNKDLYTFASGVYLEIGLALLNQDRSRLAVSLLDNAFYFIQQIELPKAIKLEVQELVTKAFKEEIIKAEKRRDSKQYLAEISEKLEKLSAVKFADDINSGDDVVKVKKDTTLEKTKTQGKNFSAKTLLADFDEKDDVKARYTNAFTMRDKTEADDLFGNINNLKNKKQNYLPIIAIVLLLTVTGMLAILSNIQGTQQQEEELQLAERFLEGAEGKNSEDVTTSNKPIEAVKESLVEKDDNQDARSDNPISLALKKVENRLNEGGKVLDFSKDEQANNKVAQQNNQGGNVGISPATQVPAYGKFYGDYGQAGYDVKRTEEFQRDSVGQQRIDASELQRGRDGRIYGPAVNEVEVNSKVTGGSYRDSADAGFNNKTTTQSRAQAGQALRTGQQITSHVTGAIVSPYAHAAQVGKNQNPRAVQVSQYPEPVDYQTIVEVTVLSAPSAVSKKIALLKSGSDIKVTSYMGAWLEIISHKGVRGYIYAQDAVRK